MTDADQNTPNTTPEIQAAAPPVPPVGGVSDGSMSLKDVIKHIASTRIIPTAGRIMLYHPAGGDTKLARIGDKPLAAIVAHVSADDMVNLSVVDSNGETHGRSNVMVVQDGDEPPQGAYCEWMPYQKGQAAKTDALLGIARPSDETRAKVKALTDGIS